MRYHMLAVAAFATALATTTAHAGLVAFYSFDDQGDPLLDDSGNGNHITDTAGTDPIWGAATGFNATGAYDFSADRLIVPINVNSASMPQMTWGAWVRTDTLVSGLYKILGHDNGAWDRTLGLDNRNPNGVFRYTAFTGNDAVNASGPVEGTPVPVNTTDWTFIAAAHDQVAKTITVHIDLDASSTADALVSITEPAGFGPGWATFAIGGIRPDNGNEPWDGAIDNVFVYDEALDAIALTAIRNGGKNTILGLGDDPNLEVAFTNPLFGDLSGLGAGPGPVARTLILRNLSESNTLVINSLDITGDDSASYSHDGAATPFNIGPLAEVTLGVTLTPPAEGGVFQANLEIVSNDPDLPLVTLSLDAQVHSDPNIDILAPDPVFGFLAEESPVTRIVTIRNTGTAFSLTIDSITLSGFDAASYSLGALPTSIPAGGQVDVEITFDDGGFTFTHECFLEIESNDADSPVTIVDLQATSLLPTPAGSLVAFYPFDNAANPLEDASGVTGDAIIGGGDPVHDDVGGFEDGCYQFDGNDWLTVALDINPTVMPHMTMGAWVRTDTTAPALRKFMGHDNGGWDRGVGLDTRAVAPGGPQAPTFRYTAFTGTNNHGPVQFTPEPVNTTDYSFVAVSYDDTNGLVSVYVDIDASTTADSVVKVSRPGITAGGLTSLAIGALRPDTGTEGWIGCVDNAFVFDGVLDAAAVTALRDGGRAAFDAGGPDLQILDIVRNPDNTVTLTWRSEPQAGITYRVRLNPDLSAPLATWAQDADMVPTNLGGPTTTYTTVNAFAQDTLFFIIQKN